MSRLSTLLALTIVLTLSACAGSDRAVDPYSVRSFDPDQPTESCYGRC